MNKQPPLDAIKQRWWIIVLFAILGAVLGWLPAPRNVEDQATSYKATQTMLTNGVGYPSTDGSVDPSIVTPGQIVLFATVGEVPKRVAEKIGYTGNPKDLAGQVDVEPNVEAGLPHVHRDRGKPGSS